MKKLIFLSFALLVVQVICAEHSTSLKQVVLEKTLYEAMTQTEMNISSYELAKYLKEKLKALEMKQSDRMFEETRRVFLQSCEKWKIWRDSEASFRAFSYKGGTMHSLVYNTAIIDLTKLRIKQIEGIDPVILKDEKHIQTE